MSSTRTVLSFDRPNSKESVARALETTLATADQKEGMAAFTDKRTPKFTDS